MSTPSPYGQTFTTGPPSANLADVLERVLDKGLVVAGDIRVNLLDIELLTIKVRLLLASADKAQELGMSWWRTDPFFSGENGDGELADENRVLRERIEQLERRLDQLPAGDGEPPATQRSQEPEGVQRDDG